MKEYTNSQISAIIDEVIHNDRNRRILKKRLIDGTCFDPLAEEFNISTRQCKRIVYTNMERILKYIEK